MNDSVGIESEDLYHAKIVTSKASWTLDVIYKSQVKRIRDAVEKGEGFTYRDLTFSPGAVVYFQAWVD